MAIGRNQRGSRVSRTGRRPWWWIALVLLLILPRPALAAVGAGARATSAADLRQVVGLAAAMGDRTTGSRGCVETADFIHKAFQELGFEDVGRHRYLLPVVRYHGARLTLVDRKVNLPLKPFALNAMTPESTPSSGLEGPLLYVGSGDLQRF